MSDTTSPIQVIPVERLPGLAAHPIIRIYEESRQLGTIVRSGREVHLAMGLWGWWCEARGFGEAEFATHYETQVPKQTYDSPDGRPTPAEMDAERERYELFIRECYTVFDRDVSMGRQFIIAERTGEFIRGLQEYGEVRFKALQAAVASYGHTTGRTPDEIIAAMTVREDPAPDAPAPTPTPDAPAPTPTTEAPTTDTPTEG